MADAKTRTDRSDYPGCECVLQKPVPGGYNATWEECCLWAMGAEASGHSGVLVGGILLCSCTAAEMTTYGEAV